MKTDFSRVREIESLPLQFADLVTLSACDASTVASKAKALPIRSRFLYAAPRSIVSTLWEVDDTFTAALMKRFYANLAAGRDVQRRLASRQARNATAPWP
jgi:CHAT domain-containing protein